MMTLEQLWNEVETLSIQERKQLHERLGRTLVAEESLSSMKRVEQRLFKCGLLTEIKSPSKNQRLRKERKLVEVRGKPLSEIIIEDRG